MMEASMDGDQDMHKYCQLIHPDTRKVTKSMRVRDWFRFAAEHNHIYFTYLLAHGKSVHLAYPEFSYIHNSNFRDDVGYFEN
jgi:hypothetical protein